MSAAPRRAPARRGLVAVIALSVLVSSWIGQPMLTSGATPTGAVIGVASRSGQLRVERSGSWRELELPGTVARDFDVRLRVNADKHPVGRGQNVVVVGRRAGAASEYRVRVRLRPDNTVTVAVMRLVRGKRTVLVAPSVVAGVTRRRGVPLGLRVRIDGAKPTQIKVKIWPGDRAEPARWSRVTLDHSSALSSGGWMGVRFAVPQSATNVPIVYRYDRLGVVVIHAPADPTPTPSPTPTPTPSPTTTPTPTPTPGDADIPAGAFFVAPNGNDSSAGTMAAPWRTLQKAANSVSAGATVVIREGTYGPFVMRRSGTAGLPITFMAYPGETAVVDGRGAVDYSIRLSAVRHVGVVGLTVQGGHAERQAGGGIMVEGSSQVVVRGNLVRDNHSFGVRSYNSDHVLIDGNEITGNAVGVTIGRGNEGTVVSNNLIHDNNQMMVNTADVRGDDAGAEGVTLVRSTGRVVVRGNMIWGNRARSYDYDWDGGAFSIHAASNWTITENVTWDNRNVLETGTDAGTPCANGTFTRNLNYGATTADRTVGMVLRCASNTLVANNTFHDIQYWVFAISHNLGSWGGSVENLRIVNNVVSVSTAKIYGIESALPASVVIDHNVVHNAGSGYLATVLGKGTSSLATFRKWTGFEANGLAADPRFVDIAANDYRLGADSPAIDSGVPVPGVTDDYAGAAPDRGYVEHR